MENYEKLNYSVSLIDQWKSLSAEVKQLEQYINYLNTPVIHKGTYAYRYRSGGRTALRVTSNCVFILSGIWIAVNIALIVMASSRSGYYVDYSGVWKMFILPVVLIIIAAVLGTVASVMLGSAYSNYINQDYQYRQAIYPYVQSYPEKSKQLKNIEQMLNNADICLIPKPYWEQADMIVGLIKSGNAKSVEEAITKLGLNVLDNPQA